MKWLRGMWRWLTGTSTLQLEDGTDLLAEDGTTPISLEH